MTTINHLFFWVTPIDIEHITIDWKIFYSQSCKEGLKPYCQEVTKTLMEKR